MRTGKHILRIACLVGLAAASGCSDPDKQVSSFTDDGAFEIRLEAERNWVFPDQELPVKVIVASVSGPVTEEATEQVELIASFGTVSPSQVTATLNGPNEELVLFAGDSRFDQFEQDLLFQFGDAAGEVGREDVELAIEVNTSELRSLVLLRQLNEEFLLDPGLDVIFIEALDMPDFERDFLFSLAPNGELTWDVVAEKLAAWEGPTEGEELDFLFSLLGEFDQDPGEAEADSVYVEWVKFKADQFFYMD